MNQLERRLTKLEQIAKPCLMERVCEDLERRYGADLFKGRAFAFLDRLVLETAERKKEAVIDLHGETLITSELKARMDSIEWTELDELAIAAWKRFLSYGRSVVRPSAPASFRPWEPRNTEDEKKGVDAIYFVEVDKEARRLWLEMMGIVEQIAGLHSC